jgi:hypothetical protein
VSSIGRIVANGTWLFCFKQVDEHCHGQLSGQMRVTQRMFFVLICKGPNMCTEAVITTVRME